MNCYFNTFFVANEIQLMYYFHRQPSYLLRYSVVDGIVNFLKNSYLTHKSENWHYTLSDEYNYSRVGLQGHRQIKKGLPVKIYENPIIKNDDFIQTYVTDVNDSFSHFKIRYHYILLLILLFKIRRCKIL